MLLGTATGRLPCAVPRVLVPLMVFANFLLIASFLTLAFILATRKDD